jgi:hypothetical protein
MKIYQTIVFCFSVFFVQAQLLQPEFSFTLYAEDGKGNKDSIIIGYHPDARSDEVLDTRFADKDIAHLPFDSVFEIRGHKVFSLWNKSTQNAPFIDKGMSKHLTLSHDSNKCGEPYLLQYSPGRCYLMIRMKYPPLKLYWDKSKFSRINNPCISRSFVFYSEKIMNLVFPQHLINQFTYLDEKSAVSDTSLVPIVFKNNLGKLDTTQANYVFIFQKSGLTVSTPDVTSHFPLKVYPNPCFDELQVSLPENIGEIREVNIFTLDGKRVLCPSIQSNDLITLQTKDISIGQYFIAIHTIDGKVLSSSFPKHN